MTAIERTAKVVVTGAQGFVGKNLLLRLAEAGFNAVTPIGRDTNAEKVSRALASADVIFHLAGSNRPVDPVEFYAVNRDLIGVMCDAIVASGNRPLFILAGSVRAGEESDYGKSKLQGEEILASRAVEGGFAAAIYRLPNLFGKWAKPNYNSAVATFCYNVARGLPIEVSNPASPLTLLYVDDLIDEWIELLKAPPVGVVHMASNKAYQARVGEVAALIQQFAVDRENACVGPVGQGLTRALYATYIAALPTDCFSYPLVAHTDSRGTFSEIIKTDVSGQFSFFTAHPGVTRGGHYHHTKTEKFLIVAGDALFRFRHVLTGETHEVRTSASNPVVVETIPGWAHDVTNVGEGELISLLWANEVFDRTRPDTVSAEV